METRLGQWGAKFDEFMVRAGEAKAEAKNEHQKHADVLKVKHALALEKLDELKAAGSEEWKTLKIGLESAWNELGLALDKPVLLPTAQTRLAQMADALLQTKERNLTVEGHTDSSGSANYNLDLSQRRAEAVQSFLVGRGYDPARIQATGVGEARQVADNGSAEGRANNRRVEIVVSQDNPASP